MSIAKRRSRVTSRRFTKEEYYRMGELGFFHGQKVELIEGRLMVLSPQKSPHYTAVDATRATMEAVFGLGYLVRMQGPIDLAQTTEPEPDVAVVVGTRAQYAQAHPTSAVLIVEVSDTTLSYDRGRKGSLYARAGIADYWIVNLPKRQVEVYRNPILDPAKPFGYRYSSRTDVQVGGAIAPLAAPSTSVAVADLMP
jgi:Uma2 family endonuclease